MQIEIFSALTNLGIPQNAAEKAVKALETEMAKQIDFGVNALRSDIAAMNATLTTEIAKLDVKINHVDSKIDHVDSKIDHKVDSIRWMIGILVPAAAIVVTAILAYSTHLK